MSDKGLAIRSIDDVERLARIAVASGYTSCRKAEEAAMLIITGHELGLSPAQSLRGIYVVSGKPVLSADLMVAVVRKSGLCESWRVVESTAERCTITTRRRGETVDATRTWTMADAKRAGITNKGTWAAYPAAMLRHRCASDLARQEYSDVIMGLYDPEELDADHLVATPPPATITPEGFAALGVEQPRRVLDALAEPVSFAERLGAAKGLAEIRAAYMEHVASASDEERASAVIDVVAVLASRNYELTKAEVVPLLSQMQPDAFVGWLDAFARLDVAGDIVAHYARHAAAIAACGKWHRNVARNVAGRALRGYDWTKEAILAELDAAEKPTPPDGTDGPGKPRNAANDTATVDGTAGDAAPADGPSASIRRVESLDAVAERAASDPRLVTVRAHIATKTARPALVNSVRAHWSEVLADTDVRDLYAARLRATTATAPSDPRDDMQRDEDARALVTQWATAARDEAAKGEAA